MRVKARASNADENDRPTSEKQMIASRFKSPHIEVRPLKREAFWLGSKRTYLKL